MHWMLEELRFALRRLARRPGRTAAILLTLTLGIGLNTALFRVMDDVLLRPLPFAHASRVVEVRNGWLDFGSGQAGVPATAPGAPVGLTHWWASDAAFQQTAAILSGHATLRGRGEPARLNVAAVSGQYFPLLGVRPILGRVLNARDLRDGKPVAVIGRSLWQLRWGGSADVVGQTMQLNGNLVTIAGVVPDALTSPRGMQVWVPYSHQVLRLFHTWQFQETMVARLRPGVSLAAAQRETDTVARRLLKDVPAIRDAPSMHGWNMPAGVKAAALYPRLLPLRRALVGPARPKLLLLSLTALFVLLVACVNVANLMLARGTEQAGEVAIRAALGASRGRLVAASLAESLLLGLGGGLAGGWLALAGGPLLLRFMPSDLLPSLQLQAGDWHALFFFTLGVSLACVVAFGLGPALAVSRPGLQPALNQSSRIASNRVQSRLAPRLLIGLEVAFTLVLLAGAALLLRSFATLMNVPSGIRPAGVLAVQMPVNPAAPQAEQLGEEQTILRRARQLPGVASAALVSYAPFPLKANVNVVPVWRQEAAPTAPPVAVIPIGVTGEYFSTLGMPLLRGRLFTKADMESKQREVIISAGLAGRLWPGQDPVGKLMRIPARGASIVMAAPGSKMKPLPPAVVIGVVGDVHELGLAHPIFPTIYEPRAQFEAPTQWLLVRSPLPAAEVASEVRHAIAAAVPGQLVTTVMTLRALRNAGVAGRRFPMLLLALFAGLALVLTAIGIYGVLSFFVARQRHEIGIRMAVGARPADVLRLVTRQGLAPVAAGLVVGMAASLALARLLRSLLFHVQPWDRASLAASALTLLLVTLAAILLPAWRAAQCDPAQVLREE